jgi:CBS domain containing-hemolysin-like protein
MQGPWVEIGLVLLLVVVNAAFAGSEVALISLREGQLRRLEQEGERGRLVAQLARDPNQFLSTIQIGITLAGFLASAAAAVALAEPLVPLLGFLGRAAEPVAVVAVTVILIYLTLVMGELNPVEGLWSSLKAVELANLTSPTLAEVIHQAHQGIERVRRTSHLAYSFLRHAGLSIS